jgi:hypothetical protein
MEAKYKIEALGIDGSVLKTKIVASEPGFKVKNNFANKVAVQYGAHPGIRVTKLS